MNRSARRRQAVDPVVRAVPHRSSGLAGIVEGQALIASGRYAPAEARLRPLLADALHAPEAAYLLAVAAILQQQPGEAVALAEQAVRQRPSLARYQLALGRSCKLAGDLARAEAAYRRALEIDPGLAEAMVSLGIVLKMRGDLDGAIGLYERALARDARMPSAHANLANALAARAEKRLSEGFDGSVDEEALDAQGRAVALDPRNPQLHRNYGVLLLGARRHREAIAAFNESLTLDSSDVECCLRLGAILVAIGDSASACTAYETWLERNPPQAPVLRALAAVLTRRGEVDRALDWSRKALALEPDAAALVNLGSTLMQARRLEESLARCREGIDLGGRRADMYPALLLGLNYLHESPAPIFEAHREFGTRLTAAVGRPAWRPRPPKLRVGYVSGDFVRHSVSYFVQGLLEHHDRSRFEVTCYHNSTQSDSVTAALKALGHGWVDCDGLSDDALRRRIVADGIDILVDLSGHTSGSRVFVFAAGAAPVQIGFLGYPTLSGVPAMDFRITDTAIDPGDQPATDHDVPLALPRSMFCYRPMENPPPLAPPPALERGHVTFGSFNNIAKVTDHSLTLWAAAMRAVPGSRLLLKSTSMAQPGNRADIERFMAAQGVGAERLDLMAWHPDKTSHLAMYNEVDIALDSFPYNGATTTCEALWMGAAVASRRGATHTSRMGASILGAIGRDDWVAASDEAFVSLVAALAADLPALARWRARSRDVLRASALFDEAGFARAFEAALDDAWARRAVAA